MSSIQRWFRYVGTKIGMTLEEGADPKVQLEQAIQEARAQHRALTEQAAQVIANQTQLQMRLDRALDDYESANASARQALVLADMERKSSHPDKAESFDEAASAYANRIVALEAQIEELKKALVGATEASGRARQAVADNALALQKKLAERESLLSQLDQAKMQEQMNAAMGQLTQPVGDDAPSLDEVRAKVERRLASAQAMTDLTGTSVDLRMMEVERAKTDAAAETRLATLRDQMGIDKTPVTTG